MKKLATLLLLGGILLPQISFAAIGPEALRGPLVSCSAAPGEGSSLKKCVSLCDALLTFKNITEFIISLALFILAPLFLGIGGFTILTAGANPARRSQGTTMIRGTIIGIIIILSAFVLISSFIRLIGVTGGVIQGFNQPIECTL